MLFCIKHSEYIKRRIFDITDKEKQNLLSDLFLTLVSSSDIDHIQLRIEGTRSKCPACFYKKPGNEKLNELCIQLKSNRKKMLIV